MSLFDSIKYPISNPPTHDEILAIPVKIFNQWYKETFPHLPQGQHQHTPSLVFSILNWTKTSNEWHIRESTAQINTLIKKINDN